MSFYTKEELGVTVQAEAPVTGIDEGVAGCLKTATIIALIEDYLRGGLKHQKFASGDEMVAFAKDLCSQALDNGDLTASSAEHIVGWAEKHRADDGHCDCAKKKFFAHVLGEELKEVGCEVPADMKAACDAFNAAKQQMDALVGKYGPIIQGYAAEFIRLYGKNFCPEFIQKLGL